MKKDEVDKIYNELREVYTDDEIADAFIFPGDMTEEDVKELKKSINKHRRKLTDEERESIVNFSKTDICRIR